MSSPPSPSSGSESSRAATPVDAMIMNDNTTSPPASSSAKFSAVAGDGLKDDTAAMKEKRRLVDGDFDYRTSQRY